MAANDFISCSNKANLSVEDILKALITVDDAGCAAIRYMQSNDSGVDFISCANKGMDTKSALMSAIGLDSNGKPALRLALTS